MVHGLEIDNKTYKHKKRDNEKDMCEDMLVWKRYVQRDCHIAGIKNEKKLKKSQKKKK